MRDFAVTRNLGVFKRGNILNLQKLSNDVIYKEFLECYNNSKLQHWRGHKGKDMPIIQRYLQDEVITEEFGENGEWKKRHYTN